MTFSEFSDEAAEEVIACCAFWIPAPCSAGNHEKRLPVETAVIWRLISEKTPSPEISQTEKSSMNSIVVLYV